MADTTTDDRVPREDDTQELKPRRDEVATEIGADTGRPDRFQPSRAGVIARVLVLAGLLLAILFIPFGVPTVYENVVARAAVFAIVAFSMNLLMGYTGQVSLGHAAFVGVGAFSAGIILTSAQMPYLFGLVVAGATGAIAALILGGIALRVKGLYLALVTIAYGLFAQETLFNIRALTGGGAGQPVPRPGFTASDTQLFGLWAWTSNVKFIYLCYAVLALTWLVDWRLTATKAGRAIQALRDDERVAASWGINITGYKLLAFVLSGAIAGVAGALFASIEGIAVPVTFSLTLSLTFVLMTVVGGLGSRPGIVQGGIIFAVLPALLDQAHEHWGDCVTAWGSGWIQAVNWFPAPGPRLLQALVALAFVGIGVIAGLKSVRAHSASLGRRTGGAVTGLALLALGVWLLVGAFTANTCMWAPFTALWEPLIGAALLILTLIFFPGGIAQQQEHTIRWLSFGPFHAHEHHVVGGGTGGGGMGARP